MRLHVQHVSLLLLPVFGVAQQCIQQILFGIGAGMALLLEGTLDSSRADIFTPSAPRRSDECLEISFMIICFCFMSWLPFQRSVWAFNIDRFGKIVSHLPAV
jgi:hypothetical protein